MAALGLGRDLGGFPRVDTACAWSKWPWRSQAEALAPRVCVCPFWSPRHILRVWTGARVSVRGKHRLVGGSGHDQGRLTLGATFGTRLRCAQMAGVRTGAWGQRGGRGHGPSGLLSRVRGKRQRCAPLATCRPAGQGFRAAEGLPPELMFSSKLQPSSGTLSQTWLPP